MKRRDFLKSSSALAATTLGAPYVKRAHAAEDNETLISVSEASPNSMDYDVPGVNRSVASVVWNAYDRLVTWGTKKDDAGNEYYDFRNVQPELAEEWDVRDLSITLKLRKNAKFHDGTPVTAKDVKYTFDRTVGIGGYPASTMSQAAMTHKEQFVAVDDHTFRVDFDKKSKLSLLYLGVPVVGVYNSELVKKHATATDPWALEWTRLNVAGGGAYKVEQWTPGQQLIFARNDDWKSGALPKLRRIIARAVPAAGTRRALLERGDVDLSYDLPPSDIADMTKNARLNIIGMPMENTVQYLGMNVTKPPFDDIRVRQALAYAVPYQKIMDVALFGRGQPLFGGPEKVTNGAWPQPTAYKTDIDKARKLLAEAGHPNGIETVLSFDAGSAVVQEPLCELIQESFGQIGVKVSLNKIPGANWRTTFIKKQLPLQTNIFGGWFNYPDFYFTWVYSGEETIFNTMAYKDSDMDRYVYEARDTSDPKTYEKDAISFIQLAFDQVPNIPLYQPYLNVALKKNVSGFRYWFHREIDYRPMVKA